jgi:glycosyltransferase involved in cell wall biosynthesis
MIRAVMMCPYYHPNYGGAENQLRLLAAKLALRGVNVTVLTLGLFGGAREERVDQAQVFRFGGPPDGLGTRDALQSIVEWLPAHRDDYDVVHHHFIYGLWPEVQLQIGATCQALGKPALLKVTSSEKVRMLCADDPSAGELLGSYSAIAAINSEIEQELLEAGVRAGRIVRVPNGVDTEFFRPMTPDERAHARQWAGLDDGDVAVLYVGRLVEKKNVSVLLRACAVVGVLPQRLRLLIVGDDTGDRVKGQRDITPSTERLQQSARRHSLDCRWCGGTTVREDVRRYYWASDFVVLPSRNEGCSNTLLEAMSCGVPCITSDLRANNEVLGAPNHRAFRPDDEHGLARHLRELTLAPQEASVVGRSYRERAVAHFDINRVADTYHSLYVRLLACQ